MRRTPWVEGILQSKKEGDGNIPWGEAAQSWTRTAKHSQVAGRQLEADLGIEVAARKLREEIVLKNQEQETDSCGKQNPEAAPAPAGPAPSRKPRLLCCHTLGGHTPVPSPLLPFNFFPREDDLAPLRFCEPHTHQRASVSIQQESVMVSVTENVAIIIATKPIPK